VFSDFFDDMVEPVRRIGRDFQIIRNYIIGYTGWDGINFVIPDIAENRISNAPPIYLILYFFNLYRKCLSEIPSDRAASD